MNESGNENSNHLSIPMPDLNNSIYAESYRAMHADLCSIITHSNESIEYHVMNLNPSITVKRVNDKIKIIHSGCKMKVKFNNWPERYESIQILQVCSLDHQVVYGNCTCKSNVELFCESCQIWHEYLFYKSILNSNSRGEFVLDSLDQDKISYEEITRNDFENGKKSLEFLDQPRGIWNVKYENYPLHSIDKKQNFLLNLVGIKKDGQMDVLKSWKWGFDMTYRNGHLTHKPRMIVESKKEIPKHLINLPNANNCLFKFQHSNKSLNKPDRIVEYPRIFPRGFTISDFERQIVNKLNESSSRQKSILISFAIIQYFLKLMNIFKATVSAFCAKNN